MLQCSKAIKQGLKLFRCAISGNRSILANQPHNVVRLHVGPLFTVKLTA